MSFCTFFLGAKSKQSELGFMSEIFTMIDVGL